MAETTHLYLAATPRAVVACAAEFVHAAGSAKPLCLLHEGGKGWRDEAEEVQKLLGAVGAGDVVLVAPEADGTIELTLVTGAIRTTAGIVLMGNDPHAFLRNFAVAFVRDAIARQHLRGAPVLGIGAGAMVLPEWCWMGRRGRTNVYEDGLGLMESCAVIPGTDVREHEGRMDELVGEGRVDRVLGLQSLGSAYFREGHFVESYGSGATLWPRPSLRPTPSRQHY